MRKNGHLTTLLPPAPKLSRRFRLVLEGWVVKHWVAEKTKQISNTWRKKKLQRIHKQQLKLKKKKRKEKWILN